FVVKATDKISDVMNAVNKSAAGVTMTYSSLTGKFTLTANNTGAGNNIALQDSNGGFLSSIFGTTGNSDIGNVTDGQNAVLTVNNVEIVRSSNTVNVDGVTLNLLQATGSDFAPAAVTSQVDSQKIVDTITNFVNAYNSLIDNLNSVVNTQRPKTSDKSYYMPLTDAQKAAMKDTDITNWETAGKTGLLNNDLTIMNIIDNLKNSMLSSVVGPDGQKISLASIGIKSASYFEDPTGKLQIDTVKLTQAIQDNPDGVAALFTQSSSIAKGTAGQQAARFNSQGIGQRFSDIFTGAVNVSATASLCGSLIKIAGSGGTNYLADYNSSLSTQASNIDANIAKIQLKYNNDEDKYYQKFSALETALAKLNQQSSSLLSSLGGSSGS
ncbi:MAG: flagellar filament capping protein FliD, partial [Oscillospiraceae bacterium]|nr:flagellar filament capping protein FliD [Oscillospiraceae bacterium]